jgi:arylsulfatase A-like enzyme
LDDQSRKIARKEKPILSARSILVLLGILAIAVFLYTSVELDPADTPPEPRPVGTFADIEALADRDDVNILFILVDTLRSHHMSAYGYERDTTPFLRELTKSSILFDRHIAQSSWTKSSMASIWSGFSPLRVGITKFDHTLSHESLLPAEILKEAGFLNIALYRNGWVHGYFGFDQGFDKYFRPMGNQKDRMVPRDRPNEAFGNDETMVTEATEFLRIHGKTSRWFLYLHMMDLHEYVYDAESALFGTKTVDLYDNSIRRTDWLVSTLYEALGRFGLLDETIVVLLSDHGEAFGERGFEGHAREVLPESTETPLLISLPFALDGGAVVNSPTSNVDVWPTLLDLLGMRSQGTVDGQSRVPQILAAARGEANEPTDLAAPIISYLDQNWGQNIADVDPAVSVVQGDYRFVMGRHTSGQEFEALFSTEDGQLRNQIQDKPEVAERLRQIAQNHLETEAEYGVESIEMDQMQLDQLRALGYELP